MRDPSDVDATLQEADKKYADDVASTLPDCESLEMIPGCDSLEKVVPLLVHCQHPHVMYFFLTGLPQVDRFMFLFGCLSQTDLRPPVWGQKI